MATIHDGTIGADQGRSLSTALRGTAGAASSPTSGRPAGNYLLDIQSSESQSDTASLQLPSPP